MKLIASYGHTGRQRAGVRWRGPGGTTAAPVRRNSGLMRASEDRHLLRGDPPGSPACLALAIDSRLRLAASVGCQPAGEGPVAAYRDGEDQSKLPGANPVPAPVRSAHRCCRLAPR